MSGEPAARSKGEGDGPPKRHWVAWLGLLALAGCLLLMSLPAGRRAILSFLSTLTGGISVIGVSSVSGHQRAEVRMLSRTVTAFQET